MLFIIGNGFDIALGLKTSYRDFLKWYLKQKTEDKDVLRLKDDIRIDFENNNLSSWADLEIKLGSYTGAYGESIEESVSFETAYRNIKDNLNKYLKSQESKTNNNLNLPSVIDEVRDFFIKFYYAFSTEKIKDLNPMLRDVNAQIKYDFATFNYTKTLHNCLGLDDKILQERRGSSGYRYKDCINKLEFIHGEVDNAPIMGVDDEEQIANEYFRKQEKIRLLLLKPHLNREMQDGVIERVCTLINNSRVICTVGTSLGESDIFWWKRIGHWLTSNTTRRLVVFWYTDDKTLLLHGDKKVFTENSVRGRFLELAGINQDKHTNLKAQIHVHVHGELFQTKLTSRKKKIVD